MTYNGPDYPQGSPDPQQPQYPGAPYPGGGTPSSPYPQPYPGAGQSYPGAGQPYGGQGGQAPGTGPYPGGDSYQGGAQPYGGPAGQGPGWDQGQPSQKKGLSIAALVLGIAAVVTCLLWFVSAPLGIAGIVVGIIALLGVKKGTQGGKGMALTGTILSGVGILASALVLVLIGTALIWAQDQIDDVITSASPTTQSSPKASESAPANDEEDADADQTKAPKVDGADVSVKTVGKSWTDPEMKDVITINSFFVGGTDPANSDNKLLGVNLSAEQGNIFLISTFFAADMDVSWSGEDARVLSALDEDTAAAVVSEYGLDGSAINPYATVRRAEPLDGWIFFEVPEDASGSWSLTWTRDSFIRDDTNATVDEATMEIPLGSAG